MTQQKINDIKICIVGTEVINGFILDTNSRFFASRIYEMGYSISEIRKIRDTKEDILQCWREFSKDESSLIINSGGLGPTDDDLTVDCAAEFMKDEIIFDDPTVNRIRRYIAGRYRENLPDEEFINRILRQARTLKKAQVIRNQKGFAPGLWIREIPFIGLPGFPLEIEGMWEETERLIHSLKIPQKETRVYPVWGVPESELFHKVKLPEKMDAGVHALNFGTKLFLRSQKEKDESVSKINGAYAGLKKETGFDEVRDTINAVFPGALVDNPFERFLDYLRANNQTIATAESCTGGFIANEITNIPGVSSIYRGSIIAYHNDIKENTLRVPKSVLEKYGAVSDQTAWYMADGLRKNMQTDFYLSVTGIAGPSGGTKEKPAGTVYIAFGDKENIYTGKLYFPFGRERFKKAVHSNIFLNLYLRYVFYKDEKQWIESENGKKYRKFHP